MRLEQLFMIGASAALLRACAPDTAPSSQPAGEATATGAPMSARDDIPPTIIFERGGVIPEGIEYDQKNERFLVGSLSEGTIFEVHNDGALTPVVTDPDLHSSVGIEVDEPRDRLLVANSDSAVFQGTALGQAKLGVYDLSSGMRIAMVDLAAVIPDAPADAKHFANDVAVSDDGTAYVTDSMNGAVYAVDPGYNASVLYQFPPQPPDQFMINGIVYDPAGFLLVADSIRGDLYKVPLANPSATMKVALSEPVKGADGVVWQDPQRLAVVSNSESRVVILTSSDNWASASVAGVGPLDETPGGEATTAAVAAGVLYAVHPHFADQDPPSITRVTVR
jgi:sugar lactone lactonase YvrE